eukprot:tig00020912_g15846.t1
MVDFAMERDRLLRAEKTGALSRGDVMAGLLDLARAQARDIESLLASKILSDTDVDRDVELRCRKDIADVTLRATAFVYASDIGRGQFNAELAEETARSALERAKRTGDVVPISQADTLLLTTLEKVGLVEEALARARATADRLLPPLASEADKEVFMRAYAAKGAARLEVACRAKWQRLLETARSVSVPSAARDHVANLSAAIDREAKVILAFLERLVDIVKRDPSDRLLPHGLGIVAVATRDLARLSGIIKRKRDVVNALFNRAARAALLLADLFSPGVHSKHSFATSAEELRNELRSEQWARFAIECSTESQDDTSLCLGWEKLSVALRAQGRQQEAVDVARGWFGHVREMERTRAAEARLRNPARGEQSETTAQNPDASDSCHFVVYFEGELSRRTVRLPAPCLCNSLPPEKGEGKEEQKLRKASSAAHRELQRLLLAVAKGEVGREDAAGRIAGLRSRLEAAAAAAAAERGRGGGGGGIPEALKACYEEALRALSKSLLHMQTRIPAIPADSSEM